MFSQFPALDYPVLALSGYHGSLGVDAGLPQNVYQLDTANMKQFKDAKGDILKKRLRPGETMTLPNGATDHLRQGHQGVGELPGHPAARQ